MKPDEEVCIYCEAETCDGDTTGWLQEEFGWKCPECRTTQSDAQQPGGAAGMAGFGELMQVEKTGPELNLEFDQQDVYPLSPNSPRPPKGDNK